MTISYAICACTEKDELDRLLDLLFKGYVDKDDEVVVVLDQINFSDEVRDTCKRFEHFYPNQFKWHFNSLNEDFSQHKNYLNGCCSKQYIFNIDPDEIPNEYLLQNLKIIIQSNPEIEAYWVPRINTLSGEGVKDYIKQMQWSVNDKGWINWPRDYQMRIYKNSHDICWINRVHERLTGYKQFAWLPTQEEYALYHPKTLERQIRQNKFYEKLID